jgi:hypothetical protein
MVLVQSTAQQTIHFDLYTVLIPRALALISNYKCTTWRAVDRTLSAIKVILANETDDNSRLPAHVT